MVDTSDLVLALSEEHKQRTGHDVAWQDGRLPDGGWSDLKIICPVCMWLVKMANEVLEDQAKGMCEAAEAEGVSGVSLEHPGSCDCEECDERRGLVDYGEV